MTRAKWEAKSYASILRSIWIVSRRRCLLKESYIWVLIWWEIASKEFKVWMTFERICSTRKEVWAWSRRSSKETSLKMLLWCSYLTKELKTRISTRKRRSSNKMSSKVMWWSLYSIEELNVKVSTRIRHFSKETNSKISLWSSYVIENLNI